MARFEDSFSEDEYAVAKTRKSFLSLIPAAIIEILIVIFVCVLLFVLLKNVQMKDYIRYAILGAVAAITALVLIALCLSCLTTQAVITNQRVIFSKGVFSKRTVELPLESIDNVYVKQGIFARIFNYGQFKIFTASSMYTFKEIAKVFEFKTNVMQSIVNSKKDLMEYQAKLISKEMQGNIAL